LGHDPTGHTQLQLPSGAGTSGAAQPAGQRHWQDTGSTVWGAVQVWLHRHWHVTESRTWLAGQPLLPDKGQAHLHGPFAPPPVWICTQDK